MRVLLSMQHQLAIVIEFADPKAGNTKETFAQWLGVSF